MIPVEYGKSDMASLCDWRKEWGGDGNQLPLYVEVPHHTTTDIFSSFSPPPYRIILQKSVGEWLWIKPRHPSALVCRLANHANALSLPHCFTRSDTHTKAPCVWGSTEGAHISLYQSRGISGGNPRLCLRAETIGTSDQSGGDVWHLNLSPCAVYNFMDTVGQWGRGCVTEGNDRTGGAEKIATGMKGNPRNGSAWITDGERMKSSRNKRVKTGVIWRDIKNERG